MLSALGWGVNPDPCTLSLLSTNRDNYLGKLKARENGSACKHVNNHEVDTGYK
jgi:hypothetical protein